MLRKVFFWLPRVVSILFILFISLFTLDVFGEPNWPVALLIHLIPSLVLTGLTVLAWRFELVGGLLFVLLGLLLLVFSSFSALIISTPVVSIGLLFLVGKYSQS